MKFAVLILVLASSLISQTTIVDNETPSGSINGLNTLFTLAFTPNPTSSLHLYRNGLHLSPSRPQDYLIGDNRIHFSINQTPQPGDVLLASYRH